MFYWLSLFEDNGIIDNDPIEVVDEDEEWMHDGDGKIRLLIEGYKSEIYHHRITDDELRELQDEDLRDTFVED